MRPTLDEVAEWLIKAKRDLMAAKILIDHEPPVLDAACFHCQQAAEKALKAFLVWQSVQFDKVHSLAYLVDLCVSQEPRFGSLREQTESLTPYAVAVRYPGELLDIERAEAADALESARAIVDFVLSLLPVGLGQSRNDEPSQTGK
jgi:HEPN domain-containing protein